MDKNNILDKDICGTCKWELDRDKTLRVFPANGEHGVLGDLVRGRFSPFMHIAGKVEKVVIEQGVEANKDSAVLFNCFTNCKEMDLSGLNTSNAERMTAMFAYCYSLEKLDLSNFDTSNVTDMTGMISYCFNLKELDLSNFNTSRVTNMKEMFAHCDKLEHLDISNFNTPNVSNMRNMFRGCKSLESLNIDNFDVSNTYDMTNMFKGCNRDLVVSANFNVVQFGVKEYPKAWIPHGTQEIKGKAQEKGAWKPSRHNNKPSGNDQPDGRG